MTKSMKSVKNNIIVADTNVLINFLKINRVDLIGKHSHEFIITDHVVAEIVGEKFEDQKKLLINSIEAGIFTVESLVAFEALEIYANLESRGMLGTGECSAISYAIYNNCKLAIDDRVAIKHAKDMANSLKINLTILTTQDIVLSLIKEGFLSIQEADEIKDIWESLYRFKLKIKSFGDFV